MSAPGTSPGPGRAAPRLDHQGCDGALSRAFGFLGKRWNGVIIGTLIHGPLGFADLRRTVGGISDSVLSERLSELAAAGLVTRTVDPGPPVSVEYRLTPAGRALTPALEALATWASTNLPAEGCRPGAADRHRT